jgi:hypothetical protein
MTFCILHVIKYGTRYFISAIIITVICDNGVKAVLRSERLITRNDIRVNRFICSIAELSFHYDVTSHYDVITVKQAQLFSLRYSYILLRGSRAHWVSAHPN